MITLKQLDLAGGCRVCNTCKLAYIGADTTKCNNCEKPLKLIMLPCPKSEDYEVVSTLAAVASYNRRFAPGRY